MSENKLFIFIRKPVVKAIISIAIILLLLYWLPVSELWKSIQKISFFSWFLVLIGFLLGHTLGAIKWMLLLNMEGKKLPVFAAIRFYFAGLFANLFLPSLAGGDIVKAGLAIKYKKEKSVTIIGTLTDRFIDTASVVLIIVVTALLSSNSLADSDQRIVFIILILLAVIPFVILVFLMLPVQKISNQRILDFLQKIKMLLASLIKKPLRPTIAFFLSLSIQSIFILLTVYIASQISIHIALVLWFLIWPLAKLSALLPISLGGIGVREAALVVLLGRLSVPAANAVALGLIWESILISGGLLGGLYYLIHNTLSGEKKSSLFEFTEQTEFKNESPRV